MTLELDTVTVSSLSATLLILIIAYVTAIIILPKNTSSIDNLSFIWLIFDALIHSILEGSFLYHSLRFTPSPPWLTLSHGAGSSTAPLALLWQEYARADARWSLSDPCVVSLELLTVFLAGPLAVYIAAQIVRRDPARHYWIIVLCTAELYGGWMTFCPEWLIGSPALNTSNWLLLWVYLVFFNSIWVVIPLLLLWHSYGFVARRLRLADRIGKIE
ncbi:Emopamil-binding protein [Dacryopinax primogenitus]|uniref:Emopamil-binding protein n=1 Tax=Dacryopinax primogenitus (strain DJM 731) TaxID=1858805 RepID=M5FX29_DACPD|nr:Emopamil-binding protein [Dacryopinax primogenitus]EJU02546.1 Emopamil-binding protein [Dacryopinax primogenitus]